MPAVSGGFSGDGQRLQRMVSEAASRRNRHVASRFAILFFAYMLGVAVTRQRWRWRRRRAGGAAVNQSQRKCPCRRPVSVS